MDAVLLSSEKQDWQTPANVLELVRQVSQSGQIQLDPCTVRSNPTKALSICSPEVGVNGLSVEWAACTGGLIFVNPPYGRELPKWVTKCTKEAVLGAEIVLLVPGRVDTNWFQGACMQQMHTTPEHSPSVLFWRGRLKFIDGSAPSPDLMWHKKKQCWVPLESAAFPSALFYWGPRHERFREVFAGRGLFL